MALLYEGRKSKSNDTDWDITMNPKTKRMWDNGVPLK